MGDLLDEISAEIPASTKDELLATSPVGAGRFHLFASLNNSVALAESLGGMVVPVSQMHLRYRRWIAGRAMTVRYVVLQ